MGWVGFGPVGVDAGQSKYSPQTLLVLCHWLLHYSPGGRPGILGIHLPLPAVRMPRSSHDSWAGRCCWPLALIDSRLPHKAREAVLGGGGAFFHPPLGDERREGKVACTARTVHTLSIELGKIKVFLRLCPCGPNSLTLRFPYSRRRITGRRHGFMSSHTERAVTETTGHMS